jgi:hypothetical protein
VQAELLAARIGDNLADPERLDMALARFAADRDSLMITGYRATLTAAKLENQDHRLAMLRAVAANGRWTQLYFDVVAGIRPFSDLEAAVVLSEGTDSPRLAGDSAQYIDGSARPAAINLGDPIEVRNQCSNICEPSGR